MFKKILNTVTTQRKADRRAELYRNLIRHEARIGGTIFGEVPEGGRREFFCLDEHTWVWHEEWLDQNKKRQTRTTRYDVRPSGILKAHNGYYQALKPEEARRFRHAVHLYQEQVFSELYSAVV
ncbi:hypothetical protein BH23PAT1_BH23PAT1_1900 [soil metagenome]